MVKITLYADDEVAHQIAEIDLVENVLSRVLGAVQQGNLLDLPVEITVACIEGYNGGEGRWCGGIDPQTGIVYIGPTMDETELFNTVVHELIHLEQMYIGALSFDEISQRSTWWGVGFPEPTDFLQYLALPWEAEAFQRETILAEKIRRFM